MKNVLKFLLLALIPSYVFAEEMVAVPVSQLTAQQKVAVEAQKVVQVVKTVDTIGEYASKFKGVGKEVGTTMREGLSALSSGVNDFAKTDAGKYTAFVIAWKIMFKDLMSVSGVIIKVTVGFLVFITFFIATVWSYRRTCIPIKVLKSEKKDLYENGKVKTVTKDYTTINNDQDRDSQQGRQVLHAIFLIILLIAVGLFIFGCPLS